MSIENPEVAVKFAYRIVYSSKYIPTKTNQITALRSFHNNRTVWISINYGNHVLFEYEYQYQY